MTPTKNKFLRVLIKLDLLVYIIMSAGMFAFGIYVLSGDFSSSSTAKNIESFYVFIGVFTMLLGTAGCIATFIKIKDTLKIL